ncbi:MAG: hypothetical protein QOJ49_1256 [Actinomycetota bacterium]|jgi:hypothetical protein|nr:hypothetical protein [Actinomycetota bacterium]
MQILGQITARLLGQHGPKSKIWQPGRPADVTPKRKGTKPPKGVDGTAMGGGGRKKK